MNGKKLALMIVSGFSGAIASIIGAIISSDSIKESVGKAVDRQMQPVLTDMQQRMDALEYHQRKEDEDETE